VLCNNLIQDILKKLDGLGVHWQPRELIRPLANVQRLPEPFDRLDDEVHLLLVKVGPARLDQVHELQITTGLILTHRVPTLLGPSRDLLQPGGRRVVTLIAGLEASNEVCEQLSLAQSRREVQYHHLQELGP